MSSAEYAAKITEFKEAKASISGLSDKLSDCTESLTKGENLIKELMICGEPMDKGKLSSISSTLTTISSNFDSIIAECDKLIGEYEDLYQKALAAEKNKNNNNNSNNNDND